MPSNPVSLSLPNPQRIRVYIVRLPFFTRIIVVALVLSWLASLVLSSLVTAGSLIPSTVSILAAYRLNTFPIVHSGILSTIFSLLALTPLLERFESQHGTLVSGALFLGPFATIPGVLYILLVYIVFRHDTSISGASIWIYLLLSVEAIILHRRHPAGFKLGDISLPIWPFPLPLLVFLHYLLPNAVLNDSLIADLCGCAVGYGFELGYLKFLVPPEKILRWIESKLNLLGRLPHYVSVDQKTYGRYGSVLPLDEDGGTRGFSLGRRSGDGSGRRATPVNGVSGSGTAR